MSDTKSNLKRNNYVLLFIGAILIIFSFVFNKQIDQKISEIAVSEPVNKNEPTPIPTVEEQIENFGVDTSFTSKSYIVYDLTRDKIVAGSNVDERLPNASTTKAMTALVAIRNFPLDRVLTVSQECIGIEGNNVGFKVGEKYYVEDLLYGLLLRSASDAVCVFATNYPGGSAEFIKKLNTTSEELGLENTNYVNAIGLDAPDHYSSSRDLLKLILEVRKIERLKLIMASRNFTLRDLSFGNTYYVSNTNELLFNLPGTVGYKTGFTSSAGECLIFGYENFGTDVIIVVMGSQNRFLDAKQLLNIYLDTQGMKEGSGVVESTSSIQLTN